MKRVVWEREGSGEGCVGEIGEWRGLYGRDRGVKRVVWEREGSGEGCMGERGE